MIARREFAYRKAALITTFMATGLLFGTRPVNAVDAGFGDIGVCPQRAGSSASFARSAPFRPNGGALESDFAVIAVSNGSVAGFSWNLNGNRDIGFNNLTLNYIGDPSNIDVRICCEIDNEFVSVTEPVSRFENVPVPGGAYRQGRLRLSAIRGLANVDSSEIRIVRISATIQGTQQRPESAQLGSIKLQTRPDRTLTISTFALNGSPSDPISCHYLLRCDELSDSEILAALARQKLQEQRQRAEQQKQQLRERLQPIRRPNQ